MMDRNTQHFKPFSILVFSVPLCLCGLISCAPPEGGTSLTLELNGPARRLAGEGDVLALAASAAGGAAPYTFRWSQERGPEGAAEVLAGRLGSSVATDALQTQGEYVFRVTVTDSGGARETRYVYVTVGPPGTGGDEFDVIIEGPDELTFGEGAELRAVAPSLREVTYRWELVRGDATLSAPNERVTSLEDAALGTVAVRVRTTEGETGRSAEAVHTLRVGPKVTLDLPPIAVVAEPIVLAAEVEPADTPLEYAWTVARGSAELSDAAAQAPTLTTQAGETLTIELTVTVPLEGDDPVEATVEGFVVSLADLAPRVRVATRLGEMTFELDAEAAPLTVANFLHNVDDAFYDGVLFHRYSCELNQTTQECLPFVIQGGGFVRVEDGIAQKETGRDGIASEADNGLSNVLHAIGMALSGTDEDSATTQFYINLSDDNTRLDGRFTVFGRVIAGFEVLDAISEIETGTENVIDAETGEILGPIDEVPVEDVVMDSIRRVE